MAHGSGFICSLAAVFKKADAEQIIGAPLHLIDSTYAQNSGHLRFQSGYMADKIETGDERPGAIYCFIENYSDTDTAINRYRSVKSANVRAGIRPLENLGDERYFHTDSTHFYFVMARKGKFVLV